NEQQGIVDKIVHSVETSQAKHCLVFCQFTSESDEVWKKLKEKGIWSATVTAKTPKRERELIVQEFRSGKIKCLINVGIFLCISEDTEILTKNGWCGIDDISFQDDIAQYNNDNMEITFSKPTNIIKKNLNIGDEIVSLDGRYVSFSVTPDHTMLCTTHPSHKFLKKEAKEIIGKKTYIPVSGFCNHEKITIKQRTKIGKGRFLASNSYNYRKKGMSRKEANELALEQWEIKNSLRYVSPSNLSVDECKFIGFWIGDGSKHKRENNGTAYSVSQSFGNPKMLQWIEAILKSCKIEYSYSDYDSQEAIICGRKVKSNGHRAYLLCIGTGGHKQNKLGLYRLIPYLEKDGTELFWGLNRKQYLAIVEGFWKADGWHRNNKNFNYGTICKSNKKLLDLLQAIGVCRGFRCTIKIKNDKRYKKPFYSFSIFDKQRHQLTHDRAKKCVIKEKNKRVWCVTMPMGTIITRNSGTVTIMGNCGFDFPELDCIIFGRPTKSLRIFYQATGRGIRIAEGKTSCKVYDLCDNVKRFGKIETFVFEDVNGNAMWRLKSNVGYITGIDVATGKDLEKVKRKVTDTDKKQIESGDFKITFGKFKDKMISEVDTWYLKWCIENFDNGRIKKLFELEVERRKND
ncbi:MAG: hypothetical protein KKH70_20565, partial [Gammaproteobacteria bacterium]|nr:hypothetical protein [Gammaproteobacteria bacterium]